MMNESEQYFADTSYLVALIDNTDVHHSRAKEIHELLIESKGSLFLSDLVVNEVLSVLAKRCVSRKRSEAFPSLVELFEGILFKAPVLSISELMPKNYLAIIRLMKEHRGNLSFNDCVIILFLSQVPKVSLISFDKGFARIEDLNRFVC